MEPVLSRIGLLGGTNEAGNKITIWRTDFKLPNSLHFVVFYGIFKRTVYFYPRAQASRVIGERSEPLSRVFNDPTRGIIGERAKRARHSQVCSIENRIYIITRKMVPIMGRASS